MRISGMVILNFMDVYKIYTNTSNHVARGSLLSDTVITKIPTVPTRPAWIVDISPKTVGAQVFALGWQIQGTNWAENREFSLHIVVQ